MKKHTKKKTYKNFKDINLNNFLMSKTKFGYGRKFTTPRESVLFKTQKKSESLKLMLKTLTLKKSGDDLLSHN